MKITVKSMLYFTRNDGVQVPLAECDVEIEKPEDYTAAFHMLRDLFGNYAYNIGSVALAPKEALK